MADGVGCLETISIADCNINITPRKDGTHNGNLNSPAHESDGEEAADNTLIVLSTGYMDALTSCLTSLTACYPVRLPNIRDGSPMYIR